MKKAKNPNNTIFVNPDYGLSFLSWEKAEEKVKATFIKTKLQHSMNTNPIHCIHSLCKLIKVPDTICAIQNGIDNIKELDKYSLMDTLLFLQKQGIVTDQIDHETTFK